MDDFEKDKQMNFGLNPQEKVRSENELPPKRNPQKRKPTKFAKYGLVLIVLCVGLAIYNIRGCNRKIIENVYTFEGYSNYQIKEYRGDILTLSYDGVKIIRPNGKQKATLEYNMSNPHININGDMILLYDKGSNKLSVYDGTKKKYSYECDQKIKSAKVNKNGYTVLISDETGYNSRITVLDDKGSLAYIWKIGDEYIVDADISPDNKKIVAATITTNTGQIVENIIFVDIDDAKEKGRATSKGIMPLQVEFVENGNALVMSDSKLCGYDTNARKKWEGDFESSLLDKFSIDENGNTVVALRGIKNNSVIRMYTKNGKKTGEYTTETQAIHVDMNDKQIAVCEKGKVSLINYSGKYISGMEIKKEVKDISVISNNKVIMLCDDCIQLLRL